MLRFLQESKKNQVRRHQYFPIFAAVLLSLLFSICVVHYSASPLFFAASASTAR